MLLQAAVSYMQHMHNFQPQIILEIQISHPWSEKGWKGHKKPSPHYRHRLFKEALSAAVNYVCTLYNVHADKYVTCSFSRVPVCYRASFVICPLSKQGLAQVNILYWILCPPITLSVEHFMPATLYYIQYIVYPLWVTHVLSTLNHGRA
jgi:hypothetical protein